MNTLEANNVINSESEWDSNQGRRGGLSSETSEVEVVSGRVNATLRIEGEPDADIQLRKVQFHLNKDMPAFFLYAEGEGELAGMEVLIRGDDLIVGKQYKISHGLRDVDARFDKAGITIYPRTVPEGTLSIRYLDSQSIEGYFRFDFSNYGREDKRKIDFYCTRFVVNFQTKAD